MAADPFHQPAAPGFDDPLGMLRACHRRIERQLGTLTRLRKHLPEHHADAEARAAASAIMRYFDTAAHNHHADEEESLFPRLAAARPETEGLTAALRREHDLLAGRWARLRPLLSAIAAGSGAYLPIRDVGQFCAAYAAHIACEESELLPQAESTLERAGLAEIGAEMAARRAAIPG